VKPLLVYFLLLCACVQAQGPKDTSFVVKGLFRVKLTNQDADQVIRNDYLLVEVQNISGHDVYFFNLYGDSRQGLGDLIKGSTKYIIFGELQADEKLANVELQKLEANGKMVKAYMSSTDEKGILFNYLKDGSYIFTDKKKFLVKRGDYQSNLQTQPAMIPR